MKKKLGIMLGALSVMLSSCIINNDKSEYYDDDHFIVEEKDSYSYLSCIGDLSNMSIKDFSGTETILIYNMEATLTIWVEYEMSRGRFKVVLINPENEIIELNGEQTFSLTGGTYRIKIIGDHASGHVAIDLA